MYKGRDTTRRSYGSATGYSARSTGGAPVNTIAPVASPNPVADGGTITTTDGTWTNSPSGFTYEWQGRLNGQDWFNGVGSQNNVTASYVTADQYRCKVTASNATGDTIAYSNIVNVTAP